MANRSSAECLPHRATTVITALRRCRVDAFPPRCRTARLPAMQGRFRCARFRMRNHHRAAWPRSWRMLFVVMPDTNMRSRVAHYSRDVCTWIHRTPTHAEMPRVVHKRASENTLPCGALKQSITIIEEFASQLVGLGPSGTFSIPKSSHRDTEYPENHRESGIYISSSSVLVLGTSVLFVAFLRVSVFKFRKAQ